MRLSKITYKESSGVLCKIKRTVTLEFVESTDFSSIYYKKRKVTFEMFAYQRVIWFSTPLNRYKLKDERLVEALEKFKKDYGEEYALCCNLYGG